MKASTVAYCLTNKHIIFFISRSGDIIEYSMIELQGELETKSQDALGGKIIGDLHFNHDVSPKQLQNSCNFCILKSPD